MAYVKAAITMTLGVQTSRSFVDCNHFKMECFVVQHCTDKRVAQSLCNSRASCLSEARCRLAYGSADATTTHCLLLQ